jgi:hypothetical protein
VSEDEILQRAIAFYQEQNWTLLYQTRSLAEGAIGGVDAILFKRKPISFVFIDAKGRVENNVRRSTDFTNVLGALIKRIRLEKGYSSVEAVDRFIPFDDLNSREVRDFVKKHGVHRNSEYILALDPLMRETIKSALDSTLAGLLRIRVLFVSNESVEFFQW